MKLIQTVPLLSLLALTGCIERRITLVSEPPGALAYLNDVEIGRTPVTTSFLWYGDYDVRFRLDAEEGTPPRPIHYYLHTHRRTDTPWFQWMGVDLFTELLPIPFKDEKVWAFQIPKPVEPSDKELLGHARELQSLNGPESSTQPATQPTTRPTSPPAAR